MARLGRIGILLLTILLLCHCSVPIANALGFTGRYVALAYFWPTFNISD